MMAFNIHYYDIYLTVKLIYSALGDNKFNVFDPEINVKNDN
jgi:hypothetical protein